MEISEVAGVTNALKLALEKWAKNNPTYAALYKTLTKDALAVAYAGLEEIQAVKPGAYEMWWATQHNRFISNVKQRELILVHEIMYHFLSAFARNELQRENAVPAPTRKKAKA